MEQKHKIFKPFDRVLVRDAGDKWQIDFYSHWNKEYKLHVTQAYGYGLKIEDKDILPYEGNEHLLATSDDPEEEIELKEGEWLMVSKYAHAPALDWSFQKLFIVNGRNDTFITGDSRGYKYAVRFKDFDPSNMEETRKNILYMKDGKIFKYHGEI